MKFARTLCTLAISIAPTTEAFVSRTFVGSASTLVNGHVTDSRYSPLKVGAASAVSGRPNTARYMSATPTDFAKSEIEGNKVVVFSKSYCPFCSATKALLDDMSIEYKVHELDQMSDGADIQAALLDMSGQRTVPNVFINGNHLGGNDDTQRAASTGKLKELLEN